jgi:DNA helicase II / ATP-dependent DNA helicase PcrA
VSLRVVGPQAGRPISIEQVFGLAADDLDEAQRAAVEHGDEPLIVVAGAGTGKTHMLTSRVAALVARGVAPERVLLLTFTRRAAADMLGRAATLCGNRSAATRMWGGTFHAVAHRLVGEHAEQLGLSAVTVLDPGDVVDLLDLMRDEHGLSGTELRYPSGQVIADMYSRAVNTGRPVRDVIVSDFPAWAPLSDQIAQLLRAFMARKRERGLLDFDDLLLAWRQLLANPVIGNRLRGRWDHVFVDEYQDVNQVQVDIVHSLRTNGRGLTVVGDDAQAVYGFRGARSSHLLELARSVPAARVIRLERNFRSLQPILDLANVVRPGSEQQHLKLHANRGDAGQRPRLLRCYDTRAEAEAIADAVLAAHEAGLPLREQAVLMRAASHSRELEAELTVRRVPYVKFGGLRFIDTAHVKDFVAVLKLTTNVNDEVSWFRLLKLHRDIGKARARTLVPHLVGDTGGDATAILDAAPARSRLPLGRTLNGHAAAIASTSTPDRVRHCLELLEPLVRAHYVDWVIRVEDLRRLAAAAQASTDLANFVADMTLDPAAASTDYAKPPKLDDDYLVLSTVHSAKGLEWTIVHLLHTVDGAFPSDMALSDDDGLDEEHRLFYVAITRARDELLMYMPMRMSTSPGSYRDAHVYPQPSRFLTAQALATVDTIEVIRARSGGSSAVSDLPVIALPTLDALLA